MKIITTLNLESHALDSLNRTVITRKEPFEIFIDINSYPYISFRDNSDKTDLRTSNLKNFVISFKMANIAQYSLSGNIEDFYPDTVNEHEVNFVYNSSDLGNFIIIKLPASITEQFVATTSSYPLIATIDFTVSGIDETSDSFTISEDKPIGIYTVI